MIAKVLVFFPSLRARNVVSTLPTGEGMAALGEMELLDLSRSPT